MIYAYREGISLPPSIFPVGYLFNWLRNQKIGHMVVYGTPKLTLKERIEHTCVHGCRHAPVDPVTGHVVGFWCGKITPESGLRVCAICEREYINKDNYQDPDYETNCPECVSKYGLDD